MISLAIVYILLFFSSLVFLFSCTPSSSGPRTPPSSSFHNVKNLMNKRLHFRAMLGSGEEDETTSFTTAIDEWILVCQNYDCDVDKQKKTVEEERLENDNAKDKRDDWTRLLSQRKRKRKRKRKDQMREDNSDDGNDPTDIDEDDLFGSEYAQIEPSATSMLPRIQGFRGQSRSASTSSRATSENAPKLTRAKRAKLEASATSTAINKLADAMTTMINDGAKTKASDSSNNSLVRRLVKLEEEAEEAKNDRALQQDQLARILAAVQVHQNTTDS